MRWRAVLTQAANRELAGIAQQIVDLTPPTLAEIQPGALRQSLRGEILRDTGTGELFIPVSHPRYAQGGPVHASRPFLLRQPCPAEMPTRPSATPRTLRVLSGCQHQQAEPVILSTEETVACVCIACLAPLPADWIDNQRDAAEREARCTHADTWVDRRLGSRTVWHQCNGCGASWED